MIYSLPLRSLSLLVGLVMITVGVSAQSSQNGFLQNNQTGTNTFVASENGTIYLIFDKKLYRNMRDEGDAWDSVTSGVNAVAIDPQNEKVLYAIDTQNHIAKTLDAGQKWIDLNAAIPPVRLSCIFVSPSNPQEVYVCSDSGLYKTTDAGFSWHATSLAGQVAQFGINPRSPSHQYALVNGSILVSSDAGNSWKKSETGLPLEMARGTVRTAPQVPARVTFVIFVNREKPFLLAATEHKGLFRTDDDGITWKTCNSGLPIPESFTMGFIDKNRVVLTSQDSLYSSVDGATWKKLSIKSGRNIPHSFLGVIGHPKRDGLLLNFRFSQDVGDTKRIGYLDSIGVLLGLNYGVVPHSEVDSVWVGAMNGRPAIYATTANFYYTDQVQQNGPRPTFISVSQDEGYSWDLIGKANCGAQGLTRPRKPLDMWTFGGFACVQTTIDGGLNWNSVSGVAFHASNDTVSHIILDPKNQNTWYYCAGVNDWYLYRYQFDPATKKGQTIDLKVIAKDAIISEEDDKTIFTDTGRLSTDGGWTWTDKSAVLGKILPNGGSLQSGVMGLVSFRNGELRAVVAIVDRVNNYGTVAVLKSGDLGSSWQQVSPPMLGTVLMNSGQFMGGRPMVFVNPDDSSNFFLAVLSYRDAKNQNSHQPVASKVFETKDGGHTWGEIYTHDVTEKDGQRDVESIVGVSQIANASGGRALLVGGSHGLWESQDEGKTWKRLGGVQ